MGLRGPRPWVFLGHTFERVGPPIFLLHFLRWLAEHDPRPFEVISLADGALRPAFEELCPVTIVGGRGAPSGGVGPRSLVHLSDPGLVYVNTAISVRAAPSLPTVDAPWVAHVHELEVGLALHTDQQDWADLDRPGAHWIAASGAVAANLTARHGIERGAIRVHHEMIDATPPPPAAAPSDLRRRVGIPDHAPVVGTVAVVNWRKAPDLFLQMATLLLKRRRGRDAHFVWVGADADEPSRRFRADIDAAGLARRIHLVPSVADPLEWMRMFSVFVLPAREDAYPLACLEAASVGCPIVCFNSGGIPEFVGSDAGIVVPFPDVDALTDAVEGLITRPDRRASLGGVAARRVAFHHDVQVAAPRLHRDLLNWST